MSTADQLRLTIHLLCDAYEKARKRIQDDVERGGPYVNEKPKPEEVVDRNGRYILLDALIAISQAETALLNAERR